MNSSPSCLYQGKIDITVPYPALNTTQNITWENMCQKYRLIETPISGACFCCWKISVFLPQIRHAGLHYHETPYRCSFSCHYERAAWNSEPSPNLHQKHGKLSPADSFHWELICVENSRYTCEEFANKNVMWHFSPCLERDDSWSQPPTLTVCPGWWDLTAFGSRATLPPNTRR